LVVPALVIGLAVGIGGAWLADRSFGPTTSGYPLPAYPDALPSGSATLPVEPALAPQITGLTDHGTSIQLTWSDPTAGRARFVVVRYDGTDSRPVLQVGAGTVTATVAGLVATQPRYCFQVVALTDQAVGVSPLRCADRG
jgi:hypothetical protein